MNPEQPQNLPSEANIPLSVMQPGERVIAEIKRHPIGIVAIYVMTAIILIAVAIIGMIVLPSVLGSTADEQQVRRWAGLAFIVFALIAGVYLFIAHYVYAGNKWVVTSDSITQVVQTGLFTKQSSQLSLGHLEDITTEQNGVLTQMLNYGVVKAETAGERSKFTFLYCPKPNYYAKLILSAREEFELAHHGGKQPPQPFRQEYQENVNYPDQTVAQ